MGCYKVVVEKLFWIIVQQNVISRDTFYILKEFRVSQN